MTTTIHDHLTSAWKQGSTTFATTATGRDATDLLKRVARRRHVTTATTVAASSVAVGAVAFGAWNLGLRDFSLPPALSPSPSTSPSPSPSVTENAPVTIVTIEFGPGRTIERLTTQLELQSLSPEVFFDAVADLVPDVARDNPEGWLAPGEYKAADERDLAKQMVDATIANLDSAGVAPEDRHEVLTIASLVEREARLPEDAPHVSSVIHNRLNADMRLELDSTVKYVTGAEGAVFTSAEERNSDSPYNTYRHAGLPPTPISAPSANAIYAAAHPTESNWLFLVTVNLETGLTLYAETYEEHLTNVQLLRGWIQEQEVE